MYTSIIIWDEMQQYMKDAAKAICLNQTGGFSPEFIIGVVEEQDECTGYLHHFYIVIVDGSELIRVKTNTKFEILGVKKQYLFETF